MRSWSSYLLVPLTLVLVLTLGVLPGRAEWTTHVLMGKTSTNRDTVPCKVAIGANGDTVMAWLNQPDGLAYAAIQRCGVWSPEHPILELPPTSCSRIVDVEVGMAGSGTVYAVLLVMRTTAQGNVYVVLATALPAKSTCWTKPIEISACKPGICDLYFGVAKDGNALALWKEDGAVRYATKIKGGAWLPPRWLPTSCAGIDDFDMYLTGPAAIVWKECDGKKTVIKSMTWDCGTWRDPVEVACVTGEIHGLSNAIDGCGLSAVACCFMNQIYLARETAPGVWQAPAAISDSDNRCLDLDLDADKYGDLAIAWSEFESLGQRYLIHGQVRNISGKVFERIWLTSPAGYGIIAPPRVAINPGGTLAAVTFYDNGINAAYAATYTPTSWSARTWIGPGFYNTPIEVAVGPLPNAAAIWPVWLGKQFIGIRASTYLALD